ncbi:MAG: hypothetical protein EXS15_02040 [Phycisphaerales bacterium]|nr:hypothetical protein [Phycisphaerales bacterium]
MAFLEQLFAITRNTFFECVRQPISLVILVASVLLVLLSNPLSAFTMSDDQRMFVDIGLSTVFMSGAILAAFLATAVVDREISNRTVLMVVSKPVARVTFILGKYLGVTAALFATIAVPSIAFLIVEVHGVMQTARTTVRWPSVTFGVLAVCTTVGIATWCNYFYGKSFAACTALLGGPLLLVAYGLSLFFDSDWSTIAPATEFRPELLVALLLMFLSLGVIGAIAVAISTRLGQVLTIGLTLVILVLGLLSDWIFARRIVALEQLIAARGVGDVSWLDGDSLVLLGYKAGYAILPNFQVFWVVDAVNQETPVPLQYLTLVVPYAIVMTAAALAVATALFQRREVG